MRRLFSNSAYGVLDYAAYPIGMLGVAPIILRHLGTAQYGVWTVATATVGIGSIIASGFGDANIQQVATWRGRDVGDRILSIVRSALAIHLALGLVISAVIWWAGPVLSDRLASTDSALRPMCLGCIRVAALLTLIRALETVCISTQRGFERYGAAVKISITAKLLGLMIAAVLAFNSYGVVAMMAGTAAVAAAGLVAQFVELRRLLQGNFIVPRIDAAATREILRYGLFTWILAIAGVAFGQSDRLIGGASLGASAVVAYALCAQVAQPIYGLTAAGLHFLFPYLACRRETDLPDQIRRTILCATLANVLLVATGSATLLVVSGPILRVLAGRSVATECAGLLPAVVGGSALLALSVTGNYALLAFGRARTVTAVNVTACCAMFLIIARLMPESSVWAIIDGRLVFGVIACLVYLPLFRSLAFGKVGPQLLRKQVADGEGA